MTNQNLYQIGLTMINGIGDILGRQLLQTLGSAEAIFTETPKALEKIPGIGKMLAAEIKRADVLKRAEKELAFVEKNKINCFFLTDDNYPPRLRECEDAPLLFYFKGDTNLNAKRVVSIVGTRKATDYGKTLSGKFISQLSALIPDILIVSGLAYGIDIISHRHALDNRLPTVAVLAHGLDRIYPSSHRSTAIEMLENGGLITDFPSGTGPDKPNFIKRNRIIAGLADATVVIESADKGGSLVTADIAFSYGRDVFAFPGRISDPQSQGCNRLILTNKAALITSADDFIEAMCWNIHPKGKTYPLQISLPFMENENKMKIINFIKENDGIHINQLTAELNIPVNQLSIFLFELELEGFIKVIPGGMYRLA